MSQRHQSVRCKPVYAFIVRKLLNSKLISKPLQPVKQYLFRSHFYKVLKQVSSLLKSSKIILISRVDFKLSERRKEFLHSVKFTHIFLIECKIILNLQFNIYMNSLVVNLQNPKQKCNIFLSQISIFFAEESVIEGVQGIEM